MILSSYKIRIEHFIKFEVS